MGALEEGCQAEHCGVKVSRSHEALWHMTGVSSSHHSPSHPFFQTYPSFPLKHPPTPTPCITSSCLVCLYPEASFWSLFPSWGFCLALSQFLPVGDISGLRRICPEGCYTSLGGSPFSMGCACTEGVWQIRWVHPHPILGRNCSLQLSNSEHVCFDVFLCIYTYPYACMQLGCGLPELPSLADSR